MALAPSSCSPSAPLPLLPSPQPCSPACTALSRRTALISTLSAAVAQQIGTEQASAFSLSISGPKEWLKGQKKKTAEFLLAPINASRDRLKEAFAILSKINSSNGYEEADNLIKVAARDCMVADSRSFIAMQSAAGVEVCTFRLILKNAASLLDDTDPMKLKADESLNDLIRSFTDLNEFLLDGAGGMVHTSNMVSNVFGDTQSALDKFEASIRGCLGIA